MLNHFLGAEGCAYSGRTAKRKAPEFRVETMETAVSLLQVFGWCAEVRESYATKTRGRVLTHFPFQRFKGCLRVG